MEFAVIVNIFSNVFAQKFSLMREAFMFLVIHVQCLYKEVSYVL